MGLKSFLFGSGEGADARLARKTAGTLQSLQNFAANNLITRFQQARTGGMPKHAAAVDRYLQQQRSNVLEDRDRMIRARQAQLARAGGGGGISSLGSLGVRQAGMRANRQLRGLDNPLQREQMISQLFVQPEKRQAAVLGQAQSLLPLGTLPQVKFGRSGGLFGGLKKAVGGAVGGLVKGIAAKGGKSLGTKLFGK